MRPCCSRPRSKRRRAGRSSGRSLRPAARWSRAIGCYCRHGPPIHLRRWPSLGARFPRVAVPSGPGALSTTFTAIAAGPCTVALAASADGKRDRRAVTLIVRSRGRSYQYPLSVAPGGRHLVDQRGTPFLLKGETAWLGLVKLTEAEQERDVSEWEAQGVTAVEAMLMNHDYTFRP